MRKSFFRPLAFITKLSQKLLAQISPQVVGTILIPSRNLTNQKTKLFENLNISLSNQMPILER